MKKTLITLLAILPLAASAQTITTYPNIDGGEDFYTLQGQYLGSSVREIDGGRTFYGNMNQSQYGYSYGPTHIQEGYAAGRGLAGWINLFRGAQR